MFPRRDWRAAVDTSRPWGHAPTAHRSGRRPAPPISERTCWSRLGVGIRCGSPPPPRDGATHQRSPCHLRDQAEPPQRLRQAARPLSRERLGNRCGGSSNSLRPEQMMSGSPLNSGGSTTSLACYIPGPAAAPQYRCDDVRVELAEWRRPDGTIAQGKSHLLPGEVLDIATRPATAADSFAEPGWQGAKAIAWALLGSGGDGRFAGLAPAALAGGAVRGGGGG